MHPAVELVGRDPELAALERFLSNAVPGALALTGLAGVGKTALTDWVSTRASAQGWRVVHAVGVEAEASFTLGGLNQVALGLREVIDRLAEPDRAAVHAVLDGSPAPAPMTLAVAMVNLLELAAGDRPVLVVVDDAHWLDEPSAVVLGAAGRRIRGARVGLLVALRPNTGTRFATAGWTELAAGPLDEEASGRIIDAVDPGLRADTRAAILDLAAGNPLALQELPRTAGLAGSASPELPLTDRLVAVFGGRLTGLSQDVRTELLRAALDGTKSGAAADVGPRYVMADVREALDADLLAVDPLGNTVFRHPLVRAAVIHQAAPVQRRAAHRHLAGLYGDVLARRAAHLSAAATEPDQQVADLLAEAALQSIRRGGATVAVDWLRRAAQLSTTAARRRELLTDAAFVASQSSRFDEAQTIADDEPAASALTGAYLALYRDGEVRTAHRRVLGLLRRGDDLDAETLPRAVTLLLAMTQYSADPVLWQQTVDVIAGLGGRVDERSLLYRDAWGDVARTGHDVRRRLARHVDDLDTFEPWEVMRLGVVAYYVDALADVRTVLRRVLQRERERGVVTNAMTMQHLVMLDLIRSGQWTDAQRMGREGLESARTHHSELFGYQFTAYLGLVAACAGDLETARHHAGAVSAWAGPRRLGLLLGYAERTAVLTALSEGDYEAAYSAAVRVTEPGTFAPYAYQAVDGFLDLIEAAVHSGHIAQARVHTEAATAAGLSAISPRLAALTVAATAMTAPDDAAGALYVAALADPGLAGSPFEHNRIRLAYGMWLRRQKQTTRARDELGLAADGLAALGAGGWAQRARAELRAAGVAVKHGPGAVAPLSAQERRIAELAAAGHSNKQIAAQLYLSPRTVSAHLYRVFPKLGVTSRAGLARALQEADGVA